jgi:hypothetical protein
VHNKHHTRLAGEVKKHNIINYELTQVIEEVDFITDESTKRRSKPSRTDLMVCQTRAIQNINK